MSRYERHGNRSLIYSHWHRFYLGDSEPMIDLDGIEYCPESGCNKPLVLVETAMDVGQAFKSTSVLLRLAERSSTLAICALYRSTYGTPDTLCPCSKGNVNPDCDHGIDRFRVKRVWPPPQTKFIIVSPEQYRDRIREVRMNHLAIEHKGWGVA